MEKLSDSVLEATLPIAADRPPLATQRAPGRSTRVSNLRDTPRPPTKWTALLHAVFQFCQAQDQPSNYHRAPKQSVGYGYVAMGKRD